MFIWVVVAIAKDIPVSASTTNVLYIPATNGNDALNQAQDSYPDCQVMVLDRLSVNGLFNQIEQISQA